MIKELSAKHPIIGRMLKGEVNWLNPGLDDKLSPEVTEADVADAAARLERFAPYIAKAFPETLESKGIIESPVKEIPAMRELLAGEGGFAARGRLFLKCDNLLPVSGSIKARGGIYEVLCLAEKLALEHGILTEDGDYSVLGGEKARGLFSRYSVAVGSTGNLGLSIGIISAKLGFRVAVHMSSDARQWKKDMLREKGAEVVEYAGDYQKAVAEGRKLAEGNPSCHFVDDENSRELFLGYAVAAGRLKKQLDSLGVTVDAGHPLFVYLPCGVGGGPGGVAYGIKQIYGENAHCFFSEPTEAPCMLLGVMTGLHDAVSVQDIGLSGKTIADGLAVGRASKFVGRVAGNLLDGIFTVSDERLRALVPKLYAAEGIFVEPSAAAGLPGYAASLTNSEYIRRFSPAALDNAAHIVWATGGGMVPAAERDVYLRG